MPSLRERFSTYFRQLSFIREERCSNRNLNDNSFITKYLETGDGVIKGPEIYSAKDPSKLPDLPIDNYDVTKESIKGAFTGPNNGCLGIKRSKLHLSAGSDIDFIDTIEISDDYRQLATSSSQVLRKQRSLKYGADQNANNKLNKNASQIKNLPDKRDKCDEDASLKTEDTQNTNESNSNDCLNKNTNSYVDQSVSSDSLTNEISSPVDGVSWNQANDDTYGLAVSLYEKNPITNEHTGSPIADCFGVLSRTNSAVLVLADGVNWGENSRLAARASVFGW